MNVRRATFLSITQRYVSVIIQLFSTVILARLLTPHEVGIYSICAVIVSLAHTLRDFGVSDYIIKEKEITREKIRSAFTITLLTAWLIALIIFFLSNPVSIFYNESGVKSILYVLAFNFILLPFGSCAFAVLVKNMEFGKIFFIQTGAAIVQALMTIVTAASGASYMSLAWGSLAGTISTISIITIISPKNSILLPSFLHWREVASFGFLVFTIDILNEFSRNAHEFIVSKILGFSSLGILSRANSLLDTFVGALASGISRVISPFFSALHHHDGDLRTKYIHLLVIYQGITIPFFLAVGLLADSIVSLLLGSRWLEMVPLIYILSFHVIVYTFWSFAPNILIALGQAKLRLKVVMRVIPLQICLLIIGCQWGSQGVAYAMVLASVIYGILYALALQKVEINLCLGDYLMIIKSACQVTLPLSGTLLFMRWIIYSHFNSEFIRLTIALSSAWLVWFVSVVVFKHALYKELCYFINNHQRKRIRN